MTVLRVNTIAGIGTTTFGPTFGGNLEFNSQNYIVLPKGSSTQQGVLRETVDVVGTGGTFYDNLVLAMPFNEATGLRDVSSRNRNPGYASTNSTNNVSISSTISKYYGSSARFDGSGDYLSFAGIGSDFNFGVGEYTIEFWLRTGTDAGWLIFNAANDTGLRMCVGNNGTSGANPGTIEVNEQVSNADFSIRSTSRVDNSDWNHVAVVRQNGQGTKIYINGTNEATGATGRNFDNTNSFFIGTRSSLTAFYNGYLQDLRIYKGLAKYTANFTPPDRIAEIGVGFTTGQLRYNTDSNLPELYDGNQWVQLSVSQVGLGTGGDTEPGARGVFGGGYALSPTTTNFNTIDYINISSTGNAITFGTLSEATRNSIGACASSTRGLWGGGSNEPSTNSNTIDFVTISSTGNATDFGDLTVARRSATAVSNNTRGIWAGGRTPVQQNVMDYITIASTGNAVNFGNISRSSSISMIPVQSPTRGVWGGGYNPTINSIDFVTISTLGNSTSFGNLTVVKANGGGCSNAIRGLFGGGLAPSFTNVIDYITISTLGNAVNFGNLSAAKSSISCCSSPIRGVWAGGYIPLSQTNVIEYALISTQGNTVDFGDLTQARLIRSAGCSNGHGGL